MKKYAVLHPMGKGEVLLTTATRKYFSYFEDYVPRNVRDKVPVGECKCEFCGHKRLDKMYQNLDNE